jgi:hypothetical protein
MMTAGTAAHMSAYQRGWRRMLVDMEIPDWDERFLAEFDPVAKADLYARAGLSSVMFSCKALTGLCFWPTKVGRTHPGIADRDVVGETFDALRTRGIAACAYYSAIYDNWAYESHLEWAVEPILTRHTEPSPHDRHGLCCPNSPGYREYIVAQIADLFGRYEFDCAFCDMTFWPGVCGCRECRERYRAEAGAELPEVVDWTSVEWCTFQAARERWISEFQALVTGAMRQARPGIAVYHNFAPAPANWVLGVPFTVTEHSDFLGGDLYGDAVEQLVITKLMRNLSQTRPAEFMTFATTSAYEHTRLKTPERMRAQVLAASTEATAFMFIDAVDPVGTANPKVYDRVREAFEPAIAFEPFLGDEPVEDVAIYFSSESKMDFRENGSPLRELTASPRAYPHMLALRGASRILQRAHIPFGVVTRRQLDELDRYAVLVLPNIARMDEAEIEAIRRYVHRGGSVYASRYTSLVETRGVRSDDFLLAEVFGAHLEREEPGRVVFARPTTTEMRALVDPQRHLTADPAPGALDGGLLRLRAEPEARILATLTLPYGHPAMGSLFERNWASIHASPPWQDTEVPVLVDHRYGSGRAIYSALDIEREESDANDRLFAGLVERLLGERWTLRCDTHPSVWVSVFRQPEEATIRICLLNSPPALVPSASLRLRAPTGTRFVAVEDLPSGRSLPFTTEADGTLSCTIRHLPEFTMLLARFEVT